MPGLLALFCESERSLTLLATVLCRQEGKDNAKEWKGTLFIKRHKCVERKKFKEVGLLY